MAQPTVSGARGDAPALTSLLTGLVSQGVVIDGSSNAALHISGSDELVAPITTVSATLVDITGLTVTVTLNNTARILAFLVFSCSSTGGGSNALGGWAVSIDGTDGTEMQRFLSGSNDQGIGAAMMRSAAKTAGAYTINGRHRRVSGSKTISTDLATLIVVVMS